LYVEIFSLDSYYILTFIFFFILLYTARASTALDAGKQSQALPFLPYPENLSGYVGDAGFDPLRFSDYFPMDYLREAEIKHGRICMLATVGWIAVDMGLRVYPVPAGLEGVTAATAHDASVAQGGLGQVFGWVAVAEMASWIGVSQMLQGSGREPGYFGFDPLGLMKGKSEAEVNNMKLKEIKNGRLAMLAFSGICTQSVLFDKTFPF
jgi:Chlorophyll A-B binding protein.